MTEKEMRERAAILAKRFLSYAEHGEKYGSADWVKIQIVAEGERRALVLSDLVLRGLAMCAWDFVIGKNDAPETLATATRIRGEPPPDVSPVDLNDVLKKRSPRKRTDEGKVLDVFRLLADEMPNAPKDQSRKVRGSLASLIRRSRPHLVQSDKKS